MQVYKQNDIKKSSCSQNNTSKYTKNIEARKIYMIYYTTDISYFILYLYS